jgi:hypothetical protein
MHVHVGSLIAWTTLEFRVDAGFRVGVTRAKPAIAALAPLVNAGGVVGPEPVVLGAIARSMARVLRGGSGMRL